MSIENRRRVSRPHSNEQKSQPTQELRPLEKPVSVRRNIGHADTEYRELVKRAQNDVRESDLFSFAKRARKALQQIELKKDHILDLEQQISHLRESSDVNSSSAIKHLKDEVEAHHFELASMESLMPTVVFESESNALNTAVRTPDEYDIFQAFALLAAEAEGESDSRGTRFARAAIDFTFPNHKERSEFAPTNTELVRAVERYDRFFESRKEFVEYQAEKARELIKNRVQILVEENLLPSTALKGLDIMGHARVHLIDEFFSENSTYLGSHNEQDVITLNISGTFNLDEMREVLVHEYVHTIAGTTRAIFNSQHTPASKTKNAPPSIWNRRSGIRLRRAQQPIFTWLNEAITEDITLKILQKKESDSYIEERQELQRLIEVGLDPRLVYDAYFEEHERDDPDQPQGKALGSLIKQISNIEPGTHGFMRLEHKYNTHLAFKRLSEYGIIPNNLDVAQTSLERIQAEDPLGSYLLLEVQVSSGKREAQYQETRYFPYRVSSGQTPETTMLAVNEIMKYSLTTAGSGQRSAFSWNVSRYEPSEETKQD